MQRKSFKRVLCLLLTLLTVLPLIVATGIFTASAATETYSVVAKSGGSIQYKGKNYATGATNQTQSFGLSSGFLLEGSVSKVPYWGTCIYSGRKDPPLSTAYSTRLGITDLLMDGLNQNDADGSHYMVSPVSGSTGTKDATAGYGREIDARFVFACFYYAWKYKDTEFSTLDERNCFLQEAVAIAYRSEWDVRLIKYGYGATTGTGTWNNTTKQWSVNTDVDSWKEDTTHFGGVTDGDSTHKAIVDAANAILKYAVDDPDGVRGTNGVQALDNGTRYVYTDANGGVNELFSVAGPTNPNTGKLFQNLLLFRGPDPDDGPDTYTIRVRKVDTTGHTLAGATFALYKKDAGGTYRLFGTKKAATGIAVWDELELADYYVVETDAPPGFLRDDSNHYITQAQLQAGETVEIEIENTAITVAEWTPMLGKFFDGGDLTKQQFTFVLEQEDGGKRTELQRVENDPEGLIKFDPIKFTGIGIYYYYVHEVKDSDPSVTFDKTEIGFEVVVRMDQNTGELSATARGGSDWTFNNLKNGAIGVKKVDQNGKPLAGAKFEIWRDPDCEFEYVGSMTTDDKGIATYGVNSEGKYTMTPGYTYRVKEVSAPTGYVVDPTVYSVTVVKNALTYANNGWPIPNESATGSWTPEVTKNLIGRELTDGMFTFELLEDGVVLQSVQNLSDGSIPFEPVEYTAADLGKHTYTIREVKGSDPTVGYDSHTVKYTVTVSYSGSGTKLTVTTDSVTGETTFTNEAPSGSWTPGVTKELIGRELTDGMFTFELLENGVVLQSVQNLSDGSIPFAEIAYSKNDAGTHIYTIREVKGSDPSVVYDGHTVKYEVTVTYIEGEPNLKVEASGPVNLEDPEDPDAARFTNIAGGAIGVKKVDAEGKPLAGVIFGVYNDPDCKDLVASVTTDADGIATYGVNNKGEYTLSHGRTYYVKETYAPKKEIALDPNVYQVTVVAGETIYANNGNAIPNNEPTGSWTPEAFKLLEGRDLTEGEFTFVLEDEHGAVLQRVQNLSDGTIPFEPVRYIGADIGEHTYTIREIAGDDEDIIYDGHTLVYTVTVSYSGTGTELTVVDSAKGSTTFINRKTDGASWTPSAYKLLEGRELKEGEFTFQLWENAIFGPNAVLLQTVQNLSDGSIPFEPVLYTARDGGTHTYIVVEVAGDDPTVLYDNHNITYTVQVSVDNRLGTVSARERRKDTDTSLVTFTNIVPTATWKPIVTKELLGRDLSYGEFFFVLEEDGVELQRVTNGASGEIFFEEVVYDLTDVGEHTYTIREIKGNDGTVYYDTSVLTYTVHVSYDGLVTLTATETSSPESATFTNPVPTGKWTPEALKLLQGRELKEGMFTFLLLDENGSILQTATNSADGSIIFAEIAYGYADVGEHTYTIREVKGSDGSVYYDSHVLTYTVKVSYSGTGTELTVVDSADGSTTFTNTVPTGEWTPGANKVLEGDDLTEGAFTFQLLENGVVLQTVSNGSDGRIPFAKIIYGLADVGTHTYTIREVKGSDPNIVYDAHVLTYTVTVSYSGTGTELTIEDSADGSTTFVNTVPVGEWTPGADKVLEGDDLTEGAFSFELLDENGNVLQTATNNADGSIIFEELSYGYADVGEHTYTIREVKGDDTSVHYDSHTVTFTVKVSYSGSGTKLTVEVITDGSTTFVNTVPVGEWTPGVDKVLEGRDLAEGEFTFVLEEDGDELQEVKNNANGHIPFESIPYGLADVGTHTYTIREVKGNDTSVYYDAHILTYTVTVSYSGTGTKLTVVDSADSDTTFTNTVPTGSWTPEAFKLLEGRDLTEGEFTFVLEEDGGELQTVSNGSDGSIRFTAIPYGLVDVGEHTYTIREVKGDDETVGYDEKIITYTVNVSYSGAGTELTVEDSADCDTTFVNEVLIKPGKIEILKTDTNGTPLAGAEFLLEWSEDGTAWTPVTYATELVKGGCTSPGLTDGKLITDSDGRAVFEEIDASLYYRLTETKAPKGMQLLTESAFEGLLPDDGVYTVSLHIVNAAVFTIPGTGSGGFAYVLLAAFLLSCCATGLWLWSAKRKTA